MHKLKFPINNNQIIVLQWRRGGHRGGNSGDKGTESVWEMGEHLR